MPVTERPCGILLTYRDKHGAVAGWGAKFHTRAGRYAWLEHNSEGPVKLGPKNHVLARCILGIFLWEIEESIL